MPIVAFLAGTRPPLPNQNVSLLRSPDENADLLDPNWPDDLDSGHPLTRAAISGDAATVKEIALRQTFESSSKKATHALLAACRSGVLGRHMVLGHPRGFTSPRRPCMRCWVPIHHTFLGLGK